KARGIGIAEVSDLDGSRLECENAQTIVGRMTGQIHQNIDAVGANLLGDLLIALPFGRTPTLGQRLKPPGEFINNEVLGIAIDVKLLAIMVAQDRIEKETDRVHAKIRRHVSDP